MRRVLWLVTDDVVERIDKRDDWWWICRHCAQRTQGGRYGLRAHTLVTHPLQHTEGQPAEESNRWNESNWWSTGSRRRPTASS